MKVWVYTQGPMNIDGKEDFVYTIFILNKMNIIPIKQEPHFIQ